jgi:hypothetical protein
MLVLGMFTKGIMDFLALSPVLDVFLGNVADSTVEGWR